MDKPHAEYVVKFATGALAWRDTLEDARSAVEEAGRVVGGPDFPATVWRFDRAYPYNAHLIEEHDPAGPCSLTESAVSWPEPSPAG